MALQIAKTGGRIDIEKGVNRVTVELDWDVNTFANNVKHDLDLSAFVYGSNDKCSNDSDAVFYFQLQHPSGAVCHSGDDRDGSSKETITIDFPKMPADKSGVGIVVSIDPDTSPGVTFGMVKNAYVLVRNAETGAEMIRYDLSEKYDQEKGLIGVEFYSKDMGVARSWRMKAVGQGYSNFASMINHYGLSVEGQ